jgi:signal transduction histidine kinase
MEVSTDISLQGGDAAQRDQARMRLYVLFQAAGWLTLLAIGVWEVVAFPERDLKRPLVSSVCYMVIFNATGFLITHLLRPLMSRWGWKQLGWRSLVPRLVLLALACSVLWTAFDYSWVNGFMGERWMLKIPPAMILVLSCFQNTILLCGWLCLYFFYHVFDRLNRSEIERFQLMSSVKEAELRALKSQVNPHFIFNSLNSLRALIDEDPKRARMAVTQLANLLRYSLQSGQLETVPFEDELDVVNDYLALEQVRHEERLRLRLDIGPDVHRLPIPPMLLQTLVENAVKYGISARAEGGEIAIVARNEGGSLRIQVTNPGEVARGGRGASTGVGLHNAAERLRLIFGDGATLRLRSDQPAQVIAEAVIPLAMRS